MNTTPTHLSGLKSPLPHLQSMASPLSLPSFQHPTFFRRKLPPFSSLANPRPPFHFRATAKFNLSELLGGRGLCNGEKGVELELKRDAAPPPPPPSPPPPPPPPTEGIISGDAFEKELLGLTGGFPGGETGLQKFLEKNPPPPKDVKAKAESDQTGIWVASKSPELPLLLPGMIVIVKNPKNPFHMYCGIVQRITDGKAGVLFEGGNWDRLATFRLEELERREKGPPMVNPLSAMLEDAVEQQEA